jgi:predicted GIY-YIG superfamily endonuclease
MSADRHTELAWNREALRALSGRPTELRSAPFVPLGAFATATWAGMKPTYHRVAQASVVWVEPDGPWFSTRTMCGRDYGHVRFVVDVPDDADSICDACIFADWTPPIVVYRFYDSEGVLLYVGCTRNLILRTRVHSSQSHWYRRIASHTATVASTWREALDMERDAIRAERPLYNVVHNPTRRRDLVAA